MSKSNRHVILTFIGASSYSSPWMRNTVMKAGQAGLFDAEPAGILKTREHKDSRGNVIPYFREEPAGTPYAFDFTQAWADAGNQPRVNAPSNRPLPKVVDKTPKADAEAPEPLKAAEETDPATEGVEVAKESEAQQNETPTETPEGTPDDETPAPAPAPESKETPEKAPVVDTAKTSQRTRRTK